MTFYRVLFRATNDVKGGIDRHRRHLRSVAGVVAVLAVGLICAWYLRLVFARSTVDAYVARYQASATVFAPGTLSFDGEAFQCAKTPAVLNRAFPDYGAAYFGFIILNPVRFETLPMPVKRFAYAHECGHQYVGYGEAAADCYAVKRGIHQGWLTPAALNEVCDFFSRSKGTAFHLPGPQRCAAIRGCYAAQVKRRP